MAGIINVTMVGKEELAVKFDEMPDAARLSVRNQVDAISREIEEYIKFEKLQGQVLNKITGALQGSIHSETIDEGDIITGRDFSDSSVDYAGVHEYGFQGTVTVEQHMRTVLFGKTVAPYSVGPYEMNMNMPEKSFMRSSLEDWRDKIISRLTDAVLTGALGATGNG